MKSTLLAASASLAIAGRIALAQPADDAMAQLRTCALMEDAERLECLNKLSRVVVQSAPAMADERRWVISQTTSPVDYSPIATATTASREGADSEAMQLTIRCRGGRTELTMSGPAISGRGDDYVISYRINGGQPLHVAATTASGSGITLKSDVAALIQSLPGEGELAVHLSPRVGSGHQAIFPLTGLDTVRAKIAATCKWPHLVAKPND
jgi:hypothetical protein